jgi:hypothetical protein
MGTWNSASIGGLDHVLFRVVVKSSTSAASIHSAFPGNRFTLQTIACCSGSYLARPNVFLIFVLDVFRGTGILITTCVANNLSEKFAITFRLIETLSRISQNEHVSCHHVCTTTHPQDKTRTEYFHILLEL